MARRKTKVTPDVSEVVTGGQNQKITPEVMEVDVAKDAVEVKEVDNRVPEEPVIEETKTPIDPVVPKRNNVKGDFYRYVAVKRRIRHPYAGVFIETAQASIPLEEDGWLKSQEAAGLIRKD